MNKKRKPEDFLPLKLHGVELKIDKMSKRIKRIHKTFKSKVAMGGTAKEREYVLNKYDELRDRITLLIPPGVTGEELQHWRKFHRILLDDLKKSVYFDELTPEMKIINDNNEFLLIRLVNTARKREMAKVADLNIHLDENGKSWAEITKLDSENVTKILKRNG